MKTHHIWIAGAILLITLVTVFSEFSGFVEGTPKSNYIKIDSKVFDKMKDEYYIQGKDPYIYESDTLKMSISKDEYEELIEGKTYFMKYMLFEDGTGKVQSYKLEER